MGHDDKNKVNVKKKRTKTKTKPQKTAITKNKNGYPVSEPKSHNEARSWKSKRKELVVKRKRQ